MIKHHNTDKPGLLKRYRILFYALGVIVMLILCRLLAGFLAQRGLLDSSPEAQPIVELAITTILLLFLIPAIMIIVIGWRTRKSEEYPPHGKWRGRRSTLLYGDEAIQRGKNLMRLGTVAILLLIASIFINRLIIRSFFHNPMRWIPHNALEKVYKQLPNK